jgi:hypothetical protein
VSLQRWVVARKTHRCTVCMDPIKPGSVYRLATVFPSDDNYETHRVPQRYRTCQPCVEGKRWLS